MSRAVQFLAEIAPEISQIRICEIAQFPPLYNAITGLLRSTECRSATSRLCTAADEPNDPAAGHGAGYGAGYDAGYDTGHDAGHAAHGYAASGHAAAADARRNAATNTARPTAAAARRAATDEHERTATTRQRRLDVFRSPLHLSRGAAVWMWRARKTMRTESIKKRSGSLIYINQLQTE